MPDPHPSRVKSAPSGHPVSTAPTALAHSIRERHKMTEPITPEPAHYVDIKPNLACLDQESESCRISVPV